jgi:hypothetical protein
MLGLRDSSADSKAHVVEVSWLDEPSAGVRTLRGETKPLLGWRAPRFAGPLEPVTVLSRRINGAGASFVTLVRFDEQCRGRLPDLDLEASRISSGLVHLRWRRPGGRTVEWREPPAQDP